MDDLGGTYGKDEEDNAGKPSVLEEEECFLKLKAWFQSDSEHWADWRKEAKEDFGFRSGEQWTPEEKSVLKEQLRPVITFNRIDPVIDAVAGTEVSNRQEVHYIPRTEGDVAVNEVYTSAAKWFRDLCDAEDEESDAFQDVLTCGVGWTETRLDYEIDEEGAPITDRIDPFELYADGGAKKRNFEDARRVFRVRTNMPVEDAMALIPGVEKEDLDAGWALGDADSSQTDETQEEARYYRDSGQGNKAEGKDSVTIVECQWWERESVHLVADPSTGQVQQLDDASFKVYAKRAPELGMPVQSVTMSKRVYYRAYLGKKLLLKEPSPFQGHFSYKAITGKRDRNKGTYYGLVRQMKDPQRWANKWLSQTLHIMNVNAKGGIMAEDGVAEDMNKFEREWARPDAVTRVKSGVLSNANGARIKEKPGAQFPAGYFNLLEFAISSVRDASGVNLELLGMADREQAGILEAQRKKSAMAILATMFDSLRRYRKSQGRLLLQIINEHLSDGRLIRIVGEEGEKYVPLTNQPGVTQFDVKVDDAPSSPHQREMTWQMLMQIIPAVKDQMSPEMWGAILPYSPLPTSVTGKLQKMIQDGQEQGAQAAQEQQQIIKAAEVGKIHETHSKTVLNLAKAQSEGMNAQANMAQAMQPDMGGEMEMESEAAPAPMPMPPQQPAQPDNNMMMQQLMAQVVQGQQSTNQMLMALGRAMTAPKRVIRGPDGRPEGVETVF